MKKIKAPTVYFLADSTIGLRVLNSEDVKGNYKNWLNDPVVNQGNTHHRFPETISNLTLFLDKNTNSTESLHLGVFLKNNNNHVGNISLQKINWIDSNAEIAFLLGESEYKGKGVMFSAAKLLINHAFYSLGIRRISCGTIESNIGMIRLAEKLGMMSEGRRRKAVFKQGEYLDIINFGLLSEEWRLR